MTSGRSAARSLLGRLCSWLAFAEPTGTGSLPLRQEESLEIAIYAHSAPGLTPGTALAATRRAAHRGFPGGPSTHVMIGSLTEWSCCCIRRP
ncbi:hypothetical protein [Streptomyces sp. NPDC051636]|uniref:hypothetical protein n=1 Tax=Streptomyces sp. NPDC051636 TaxID=3365663 RepID=UPI0037966E47